VSAAEDWARDLASWAIPPEILARRPEDPWAFRVASFVRATEQAMTVDTPSLRRAREAIPPGGSVLDVGCGAGAASLPLCPPAASVAGIDESPGMLSAFADQAVALGIDHREIQGRWPDVAHDVNEADVVVCNHVLYNIADLGPFVLAMAHRARRRTVIEMTSEHPRVWMRPLWRALHDIDRPTRPVADDAIAVLRELGIEPHVERWLRPTPMKDETIDELVESVRDGLCVNVDRDAEIAEVLRNEPPPAEREITTLWWDAS
jgi:ubiquinone/menaquinone biosynthesis C-methylase UbiE